MVQDQHLRATRTFPSKQHVPVEKQPYIRSLCTSEKSVIKQQKIHACRNKKCKQSGFVWPGARMDPRSKSVWYKSFLEGEKCSNVMLRVTAQRAEISSKGPNWRTDSFWFHTRPPGSFRVKIKDAPIKNIQIRYQTSERANTDGKTRNIKSSTIEIENQSTLKSQRFQLFCQVLLKNCFRSWHSFTPDWIIWLVSAIKKFYQCIYKLSQVKLVQSKIKYSPVKQ